MNEKECNDSEGKRERSSLKFIEGDVGPENRRGEGKSNVIDEDLVGEVKDSSGEPRRDEARDWGCWRIRRRPETARWSCSCKAGDLAIGSCSAATPSSIENRILVFSPESPELAKRLPSLRFFRMLRILTGICDIRGVGRGPNGPVSSERQRSQSLEIWYAQWPGEQRKTADSKRGSAAHCHGCSEDAVIEVVMLLVIILKN